MGTSKQKTVSVTAFFMFYFVLWSLLTSDCFFLAPFLLCLLLPFSVMNFKTHEIPAGSLLFLCFSFSAVRQHRAYEVARANHVPSFPSALIKT